MATVRAVQVAQRAALARAVARADSARLLTRDNSAGDRLTVEQAAGSGHAYFVTPRPELLVVDIDLPRDPGAAADLLAAFDVLVDAARAAGVAHVRVPSGRPGHQHGFFVTGTGPARGRLERWARERGMDVRTRGVRPPGAPHRLGGPLAWDPTTAEVQEAVAVLSGAADLGATVALAARLCPLVLPGRVQVAVRHGYAHAGYASPSHARMALAVAVQARGGSQGLLETILRDRTSPLGATFRDRPAAWQRAEVSRLWDKAAAWISGGGRTDPRAHLRRVAGAAHHWPWRGTAGGSDLAVLEELVRTAQRAGARVVGAALADLAVGAGVSVDTARAAIARLTGAGWVRPVAQETARTTRTYELLVPRHAAPTDATGTPVDVVPDAGEFGDLGADAARWGALGKVSVRVARQVRRAPGTSAGDIARTLAMRTETVRFHLRKLAAHGVAVSVSGRWSITGGRDRLLEVAQRLGRAGARARQVADVAAARLVRAAARAAFAQAIRSGPGPHPSPTP